MPLRLKVRGIPLNSMSELGANPFPLTVSVNVVEFAGALAGLSDVIDGTGRLMYSWQDARSTIPRSNPPVASFVCSFNPDFFTIRPWFNSEKKAIRESTKDDSFGQLGCSAPSEILPSLFRSGDPLFQNSYFPFIFRNAAAPFGNCFLRNAFVY